MELLKVILDFVAKIMDPLVVLFVIILFKPELGSIIERLKGILKGIEEGRLIWKYKDSEISGSLSEATAKKLKNSDLDSAAKTIQELLSPAAPLAVGYAENFLAKIKRFEEGIQFWPKNNPAASTKGVYTIYIPYKLTDEEAASPDLTQKKYPGREIQTIEIEPKVKGPKIILGSAISHEGRLLPVEVPQTMTSIRHIFRYRHDQLIEKGRLGVEQVKKMEAESLENFAELIEQKIEELELSRCVRVIRESSDLFLDDANKQS